MPRQSALRGLQGVRAPAGRGLQQRAQRALDAAHVPLYHLLAQHRALRALACACTGTWVGRGSSRRAPSR